MAYEYELANEVIIPVKTAVREFILCTDEMAASLIWEGRVQPLLAHAAKTLGVNKTVILEVTEYWVKEGAETFLLDAAELKILEKAGKLRPGILSPRALNILMLVLTMGGEAGAAVKDPDNWLAYRKYIRKYIDYILRAMELGRSSRMPPPLTYLQWVEYLQNGMPQGLAFRGQTPR